MWIHSEDVNELTKSSLKENMKHWHASTTEENTKTKFCFNTDSLSILSEFEANIQMIIIEFFPPTDLFQLTLLPDDSPELHSSKAKKNVRFLPLNRLKNLTYSSQVESLLLLH